MTGAELSTAIIIGSRSLLAAGIAYEKIRDIVSAETEMTQVQFDLLMGVHKQKEDDLTKYYANKLRAGAQLGDDAVQHMYGVEPNDSGE